MPQRFLFIILFLCALIGGCGENQKIEIVKADFGIYNNLQSGRPAFQPSDVVPFINKQQYGWVIVLKTNKKQITYKEEFTLPSRPSSWGAPEPIGTRTISPDGKTATTIRKVDVVNGLLINGWEVIAGDPPGVHQVRVTVENEKPILFTFTLGAGNG